MACLVAALMLFPLQSAKACSCFMGDPRDEFARADAAFVGTFVEKHLAEPPDPDGGFNSGDDTIYTFVLETEYKGELGNPGDTVEVHSAFAGASCGLEVVEGESYGFFLEAREPDMVWASNLCRQTSPEMMAEAASPLPEPDGEGPVRMVVGGSFGAAQLIGLDAEARTLGYGMGDTDVYRLDVCPGGERAVELGRPAPYPEPPHLFVRDLSTYETVGEIALPFGRVQQWRRLDPQDVQCRDNLGERAVVFATNYNEPEAKSVLLAVEGNGGAPIHEGTARSATFAGRSVYLQTGNWGRDLVKVNLATGAVRSVARLPGLYSSRLALSPDRDRLAGLAYPDYRDERQKPVRFYTVDVSGGRATIRIKAFSTPELFGEPGWMSARRPIAFISYPGPSQVFDLRLRTVARFGVWETQDTVMAGRTAWGTGYDGALYKVRLPDGDVVKVRDLPSPVAGPLDVVP